MTEQIDNLTTQIQHKRLALKDIRHDAYYYPTDNIFIEMETVENELEELTNQWMLLANIESKKKALTDCQTIFFLYPSPQLEQQISKLSKEIKDLEEELNAR